VTDRREDRRWNHHRGEGTGGDHEGPAEYRTLGTGAHVHAESGAVDAFIDAL